MYHAKLGLNSVRAPIPAHVLFLFNPIPLTLNLAFAKPVYAASKLKS